MGTPDRIIFLLDMDAFFASVEEREDPDLKGHPVIVVGSTSTRSVVCAANYEVRRYGVHSAMAYSRAMRLCPHAKVITAHPDIYRATSRRIFAICETFTDLVEISSIDECYLDMAPTAERFGGAVEAARALKNRIRTEEKLTCTIGIAPNKMLAKLAAGMKKPDGLFRITAQDVPRLLAELPVGEINGIGGKTAEKLKSIGVTTAGSLATIDRSVLCRMFGKIGDWLADVSRGIDHSPVVPYYNSPAPKSVSNEHTLENNTHDMELLRRTLRSLSEQVASSLRKSGLSAKTVGLTLRYSNFERITRSKTLNDNTDDGLLIYQSILPLLGAVMKNSRSVRLIGVFTGNLTQGATQHGLFDNPKLKSLTEAVDAMNDKLGKIAVKPASLVNIDHDDHITYQG
ncbi:MAG: DNA polymerase IV [Armatimonadota bacterium]